MLYKYRYTKRAVSKIRAFYTNVAMKYRHAYSLEDMNRNIRDAFLNIYSIEKQLPRRQPTLNRWQNYFMAHSGQWYYAYTINEDIITVVDACHAQNMHD